MQGVSAPSLQDTRKDRINLDNSELLSNAGSEMKSA